MTGIRRCDACGRTYHYDLPICSFCDLPLDRVAPAIAAVLAVTEVSVPSLDHPEVPYWCALTETADGVKRIVKSETPLEPGDAVEVDGRPEEATWTVGIIGSGVMGKGLVELLLLKGHRVVWLGRATRVQEAARGKVVDRLGRVLDEAGIDKAMHRLELVTDGQALAGCDIVIEAVIEEVDSKREVLRRAEAAMCPGALLATNTSGLPVDELAAVLERPEDFGVLHFFNPAARMKLVEVSRGSSTSDDAFARLTLFAEDLGKRPIPVSARAGFVVNRTLMPLINEAVRSLEEGAASAEDIDEAIRLGLNHPMGPLALADLIGLDVIVEIMENIVAKTGDESYSPRPMLRRLLAEDRLGRKTGAGFYEY